MPLVRWTISARLAGAAPWTSTSSTCTAPHCPYADEWSNAAGRAAVVDVARQVVVADEERPGAEPLGERPRRGADVLHGVGDLDDPAELEGAVLDAIASAHEPPNSPTGRPVPRRWHVSLSESTLRSPLRAAAMRWIDV